MLQSVICRTHIPKSVCKSHDKCLSKIQNVRWISFESLPIVAIESVTSQSSSSGRQDASITNALKPFYRQSPVIMKNYAASWTAVKHWSDWDYLKRKLDDDNWHCDLEMGAYNSGGGGTATERLCIPFHSVNRCV